MCMPICESIRACICVRASIRASERAPAHTWRALAHLGGVSGSVIDLEGRGVVVESREVQVHSPISLDAYTDFVVDYGAPAERERARERESVCVCVCVCLCL